MSTKPSKFALEHAPWSTSKVNVAAQCPRKFHLNYVVKKRTKERQNSAALIGKATHLILEDMVHVREWEPAYEKAITKEGLTTQEIGAVDDFKPDIHMFLDLLDRYVEHHGIEVVLCEKKMGMDIRGKAVGFFDNDRAFFRGVVDLTLLIEGAKNHAIVLDHKSGRIKDIDDYMPQLKGYALLTRAAYPQITHVQCGIHHLLAPKESKVVFTPLWDIIDMQRYWDEMIEYINNATRETHKFDETRTGWWCNYCDYRVDCPTRKGCSGGNEEHKEEGGASKPSQ